MSHFTFACIPFLTPICCKFISLATLNQENNCSRHVKFHPHKTLHKVKGYDINKLMPGSLKLLFLLLFCN